MSRSIFETILAGRESVLQLRGGETLFREGETPRGIYVLQSGSLSLLFDASGGRAKPLREVQPGQILGLSSVVGQGPHDCTATAMHPCEVVFIERDDFLKALEDSPAIWFNVLRLLSTEVHSVYDGIRTLGAR